MLSTISKVTKHVFYLYNAVKKSMGPSEEPCGTPWAIITLAIWINKLDCGKQMRHQLNKAVLFTPNSCSILCKRVVFSLEKKKIKTSGDNNSLYETIGLFSSRHFVYLLVYLRETTQEAAKFLSLCTFAGLVEIHQAGQIFFRNTRSEAAAWNYMPS